MTKKFIIFCCCIFLYPFFCTGENGYRLWLRYDQIEDGRALDAYRNALQGYQIFGTSPTLEVVQKELEMGLSGLLGTAISSSKTANQHTLIVGKVTDLSAYLDNTTQQKVASLSDEGYHIFQHSTTKNIIITAKTDAGVLYGTFRLLRHVQTLQSIDGIAITDDPKLDLRLLNHWDNLDRTVERGYAGFSIWDWHKLPDYLDPRYTDYARANASIGINGTVLTNVNANALVMRADYLEKVKALADVMRPYHIKVYLTARFSAPIELGGLETADPTDPQVRQWWKDKVEEIYQRIPDFGGFLVKANSEGQPGPQSYGKSHADGANMLADALQPYGGIVMWRAFVYSDDNLEDRAKQAYAEFVPLDGQFRDNVFIQIKNGPIDFMPREAVHPLFGSMPQTSPMMEFQITQEYLGQGTHLVYLAPMYEEVIDFDMHTKGKGSTVGNILDGSVHQYQNTGIAGVSNIGNNFNWTGHLFGQANWYAFGRLAWNYELSAQEIADEWLRMTFTNDASFVEEVKGLMMRSHEACVKYMTPLGLHHIMGPNHHYGPGPWVKEMSRPDWTSVYYHKADSEGIGFDRTASGSHATEQYPAPVAEMFNDLTKIPEKYLLWFHHVGWKEKMDSGRTLWEELCYQYHEGVEEVRAMQKTWQNQKDKVDQERFQQVEMLLTIQEKEAVWWRNACLLYFQTFSNMPLPANLEQPDQSLDDYLKLTFPYAPGIRPKW